MPQRIVHKLHLLFIPCQENNHRPKFLESRILVWLLVFLIISKLVIVSLFVYLPRTTLFADLLAALTKSALIEMTNQERQALELNPLTVNQKLETAAYFKAQDMMEKDYFSHQSPAGVQPWYWLGVTKYNYQYAGENLAIGFLDSDEVIKAWKESPSHRDNLLSPNYQEIGIAVLRGNFQGSDTSLVVQFLGTPTKEKVTPPAIVETEKEKETEEKEPVSSQEETMPIEETEALSEEEISKKIEEKKVTEGNEPKIAAYRADSQEPTLSFLMFQFIARDYPNLIQKIIFYLLLLVIIALILNIVIRFNIQDRSLILRAILLIFLLILLVIFDKEVIIQLIPHNLLI